MAAGLGFKDFTTGEVLTAADVDGYLMQGIWVFASAAARDAAVTSPQEGNACYLKDTDVIQVYTGSAWAAQSASNPISANIVDAKGDLIVGTAADTVSRLAVGTNGYTLVADSAEATGLKWAAASSTPTFVGCRLRKTSAQSLDNATGTVITFDAEDFDTDGFHSTVTNTGRITIPSGKAGKYLITALMGFDESSTGTRQVTLRKNGTAISYAMQLTAPGAIEPQYSFIDIRELAEADYLEIMAYQSSGGSLNYPRNNEHSLRVSFAVQYLGA